MKWNVQRGWPASHQLRPSDRSVFRSHFQHLSRADTRMRFLGSLGEVFLDWHPGRVMSPSMIILGAFGKLGLLGVSELSLTGRMREWFFRVSNRVQNAPRIGS